MRITTLIAIGASFRGLRDGMRAQGALGDQMGVLRERMANLEGLREAIAGRRVA